MYIDLHNVGSTIEDLARDFWSRRNFFLSDQRPAVLLSYRMSMGDYDNEIFKQLFVHFVVQHDRWNITISELAEYELDHNELVFQNPGYGSALDDDRITSWRHYAFSDLVRPRVSEKILFMTADMKGVNHVYLHDTMPIQEYRRAPVTAE